MPSPTLVARCAMVVSYDPIFTIKEYLALEAAAETKHEYCGGRIIAMAGAEPEHNLIAGNIQTELKNALAERACWTLGSDQRVWVAAIGEYFYPDLSITCLEPQFVEPKPRSLANPQVIVEVLSQSTERYDRGDKWSAYQRLASLTDYVMVSSTRREIEHYQRTTDGGWILRTVTSGGCTLTNSAVLDLASVYRLVPKLG
jgi:Uma2 family endonuclease